MLNRSDNRRQSQLQASSVSKSPTEFTFSAASRKNLQRRKIHLIKKHLRQSWFICTGMTVVVTCLIFVIIIEIYLRLMLTENNKGGRGGSRKADGDDACARETSSNSKFNSLIPGPNTTGQVNTQSNLLDLDSSSSSTEKVTESSKTTNHDVDKVDSTSIDKTNSEIAEAESVETKDENRDSETSHNGDVVNCSSMSVPENLPSNADVPIPFDPDIDLHEPFASIFNRLMTESVETKDENRDSETSHTDDVVNYSINTDGTKTEIPAKSKESVNIIQEAELMPLEDVKIGMSVPDTVNLPYNFKLPCTTYDLAYNAVPFSFSFSVIPTTDVLSLNLYFRFCIDLIEQSIKTGFYKGYVIKNLKFLCQDLKENLKNNIFNYSYLKRFSEFWNEAVGIVRNQPGFIDRNLQLEHSECNILKFIENIKSIETNLGRYPTLDTTVSSNSYYLNYHNNLKKDLSPGEKEILKISGILDLTHACTNE